MCSTKSSDTIEEGEPVLPTDDNLVDLASGLTVGEVSLLLKLIELIGSFINGAIPAYWEADELDLNTQAMMMLFGRGHEDPEISEAIQVVALIDNKDTPGEYEVGFRMSTGRHFSGKLNVTDSEIPKAPPSVGRDGERMWLLYPVDAFMCIHVTESSSHPCVECQQTPKRALYATKALGKLIDDALAGMPAQRSTMSDKDKPATESAAQMMLKALGRKPDKPVLFAIDYAELEARYGALGATLDREKLNKLMQSPARMVQDYPIHQPISSMETVTLPSGGYSIGATVRYYRFKLGEGCKIHSHLADCIARESMHSVASCGCTITPIEVPHPIKTSFLYKACNDCRGSNCSHLATGGACHHSKKHDTYMEYEMGYTTCSCGTIKISKILQSFEPHLEDIAAQQSIERVKNRKAHTYSDPYIPHHCCACGTLRAEADKISCTPLTTRGEVMARVESSIGRMTKYRQYLKHPEKEVTEQEGRELYRGNVSVVNPEIWNLVGGPLRGRL